MKTCLICGARNGEAPDTCVACGEASWSDEAPEAVAPAAPSNESVAAPTPETDTDPAPAEDGPKVEDEAPKGKKARR